MTTEETNPEQAAMDEVLAYGRGEPGGAELMARNRIALCQLAEYYDERDKIGLPFYEQGVWGYTITPNDDYAKARDLLESYIANDEENPDIQGDVDDILELVYTEGSCFTFGCVAGNAAAALGYEGKRSLYGRRLIEWDSVRLRGTNDEFSPVSGVAADALGLTRDEAEVMFGSNWKPKEGLSMGSVLRRLAGGAHILHVSSDGVVMANYYRFVGEPDFSKAYVDAVADQIEARRQKKLEEAEFV